jgi:hypothetical protein
MDRQLQAGEPRVSKFDMDCERSLRVRGEHSRRTELDEGNSRREQSPAHRHRIKYNRYTPSKGTLLQKAHPKERADAGSHKTEDGEENRSASASKAGLYLVYSSFSTDSSGDSQRWMFLSLIEHKHEQALAGAKRPLLIWLMLSAIPGRGVWTYVAGAT